MPMAMLLKGPTVKKKHRERTALRQPRNGQELSVDNQELARNCPSTTRNWPGTAHRQPTTGQELPLDNQDLARQPRTGQELSLDNQRPRGRPAPAPRQQKSLRFRVLLYSYAERSSVATRQHCLDGRA